MYEVSDFHTTTWKKMASYSQLIFLVMNTSLEGKYLHLLSSLEYLLVHIYFQ